MSNQYVHDMESLSAELSSIKSQIATLQKEEREYKLMEFELDKQRKQHSTPLDGGFKDSTGGDGDGGDGGDGRSGGDSHRNPSLGKGRKASKPHNDPQPQADQIKRQKRLQQLSDCKSLYDHTTRHHQALERQHTRLQNLLGFISSQCDVLSKMNANSFFLSILGKAMAISPSMAIQILMASLDRAKDFREVDAASRLSYQQHQAYRTDCYLNELYHSDLSSYLASLMDLSHPSQSPLSLEAVTAHPSTISETSTHPDHAYHTPTSLSSPIAVTPSSPLTPHAHICDSNEMRSTGQPPASHHSLGHQDGIVLPQIRLFSSLTPIALTPKYHTPHHIPLTPTSPCSTTPHTSHQQIQPIPEGNSPVLTHTHPPDLHITPTERTITYIPAKANILHYTPITKQLNISYNSLVSHIDIQLLSNVTRAWTLQHVVQLYSSPVAMRQSSLHLTPQLSTTTATATATSRQFHDSAETNSYGSSRHSHLGAVMHPTSPRSPAGGYGHPLHRDNTSGSRESSSPHGFNRVLSVTAVIESSLPPQQKYSSTTMETSLPTLSSTHADEGNHHASSSSSNHDKAGMLVSSMSSTAIRQRRLSQQLQREEYDEYITKRQQVGEENQDQQQQLSLPSAIAFTEASLDDHGCDARIDVDQSDLTNNHQDDDDDDDEQEDAEFGTFMIDQPKEDAPVPFRPLVEAPSSPIYTMYHHHPDSTTTDTSQEETSTDDGRSRPTIAFQHPQHNGSSRQLQPNNTNSSSLVWGQNKGELSTHLSPAPPSLLPITPSSQFQWSTPIIHAHQPGQMVIHVGSTHATPLPSHGGGVTTSSPLAYNYNHLQSPPSDPYDGTVIRPPSTPLGYSHPSQQSYPQTPTMNGKGSGSGSGPGYNLLHRSKQANQRQNLLFSNAPQSLRSFYYLLPPQHVSIGRIGMMIGEFISPLLEILHQLAKSMIPFISVTSSAHRIYGEMATNKTSIAYPHLSGSDDHQVTTMGVPTPKPLPNYFQSSANPLTLSRQRGKDWPMLRIYHALSHFEVTLLSDLIAMNGILTNARQITDGQTVRLVTLDHMLDYLYLLSPLATRLRLGYAQQNHLSPLNTTISGGLLHSIREAYRQQQHRTVESLSPGTTYLPLMTENISPYLISDLLLKDIRHIRHKVFNNYRDNYQKYRTLQGLQEQKRSKEIENKLMDDHLAKKYQKQYLVIGSRNVGKSTLMKQNMRLFSKVGFTSSQHDYCELLMFLRIVLVMKLIIYHSDSKSLDQFPFSSLANSCGASSVSIDLSKHEGSLRIPIHPSDHHQYSVLNQSGHTPSYEDIPLYSKVEAKRVILEFNIGTFASFFEYAQKEKTYAQNHYRIASIFDILYETRYTVLLACLSIWRDPAAHCILENRAKLGAVLSDYVDNTHHKTIFNTYPSSSHANGDRSERKHFITFVDGDMPLLQRLEELCKDFRCTYADIIALAAYRSVHLFGSLRSFTPLHDIGLLPHRKPVSLSEDQMIETTLFDVEYPLDNFDDQLVSPIHHALGEYGSSALRFTHMYLAVNPHPIYHQTLVYSRHPHHRLPGILLAISHGCLNHMMKREG